MIKNIIDMFKNGGMLEAFELSDSLPWSSESKTTYLTLRREYVSPPIGYQEENLRNRLILLLSENFGNSQNVEVLSYSIVSSLLGEDLVPQKRHFTSRQSKHNLVLLQGYPNCGLHYFILWKHHNKKCSFKPIKANFITNIDNEINFWDILVQSLNLPVDIKGTKKDIPTLIASKI